MSAVHGPTRSILAPVPLPTISRFQQKPHWIFPRFGDLSPIFDNFAEILEIGWNYKTRNRLKMDPSYMYLPKSSTVLTSRDLQETSRRLTGDFLGDLQETEPGLMRLVITGVTLVEDVRHRLR